MIVCGVAVSLLERGESLTGPLLFYFFFNWGVVLLSHALEGPVTSCVACLGELTCLMLTTAVCFLFLKCC